MKVASGIVRVTIRAGALGRRDLLVIRISWQPAIRSRRLLDGVRVADDQVVEAYEAAGIGVELSCDQRLAVPDLERGAFNSRCRVWSVL